jgi:hypothetical protein
MALVASQRIALCDYATDLVRTAFHCGNGQLTAALHSNFRDFTRLPPERRWLATISAKSVAKIT